MEKILDEPAPAPIVDIAAIIDEGRQPSTKPELRTLGEFLLDIGYTHKEVRLFKKFYIGASHIELSQTKYTLLDNALREERLPLDQVCARTKAARIKEMEEKAKRKEKKKNEKF